MKATSFYPHLLCSTPVPWHVSVLPLGCDRGLSGAGGHLSLSFSRPGLALPFPPGAAQQNAPHGRVSAPRNQLPNEALLPIPCLGGETEAGSRRHLPSSVPRAVLRGLCFLRRRRPQQGRVLAGGWVSPLAQDRPLDRWGSDTRQPGLPATHPGPLALARETVGHAMPSALHVTKLCSLAHAPRTSHAAGGGPGTRCGCLTGVCP